MDSCSQAIDLVLGKPRKPTPVNGTAQPKYTAAWAFDMPSVASLATASLLVTADYKINVALALSILRTTKMAYAEVRNTKITISEFKNKSDKHPKAKTIAWHVFTASLCQRDVRRKKDGPAFSGAEYTSGATRGNDGVQCLNVIVQDYDDLTPAEVATLIENAKHFGWPCVIYSTQQHTAENGRLRMVGLPSRSIRPDEWEKASLNMSYLLGAHADQNANSISTIYFRPSCTVENKDDAFSLVLKGEEPIDVDELLEIEVDPAFIEAHKKRRKTGSKSSASQVGSHRQIAEEARTTLFNDQIMYYHEDFWAYQTGHWSRLDEKTEVMKPILENYPALVARDINEVRDTLKIMVSDDARPKCSADILLDHDVLERLICVNNGTLDPVTGHLYQHSPNHRILSALDIPWIPNAKSPRFLQFLNEIWGAEADYRQRVEFIQEFAGYVLYNSNKFERFVWFTGSGANGKSVLLEVIAMLAGEANTTWAHLDRLGRPAFRATLEGKMLNISTEMNANSTVIDGNLKSITSGERIEAEPKYKQSFSFAPRVKLMAATNNLPRLLDMSEGFGRRAVILAFNKVFSEQERDANLKEKLAEELAGILAWAVEGLKRLLARGRFVPPPSSEQLVADYRKESNSAAMFQDQCLDPCPKGTPVGELYEAYREYCTAGGFHATNVAMFGRRLTELRIKVIGKSNGKPIRAAKLRSGSAGSQGHMGSNGSDNGVSTGAARRKISAEEGFASLDE